MKKDDLIARLVARNVALENILKVLITRHEDEFGDVILHESELYDRADGGVRIEPSVGSPEFLYVYVGHED